MSRLFTEALTDVEWRAWETAGTRTEQEVILGEVVERQHIELKRLRDDETKCHQRLIRKVADQETEIRRWRVLASSKGFGECV